MDKNNKNYNRKRESLARIMSEDAAFKAKIKPFDEIFVIMLERMNLKCPCCDASIAEHFKNNPDELKKILQDSAS